MIGPSSVRITSSALISCGVASQPVAAVGPLFGDQQTGLTSFCRTFESSGSGIRYASEMSLAEALARAARDGQVPQGDQPVIRFFGQLQHTGTSDLRLDGSSPTELVLFVGYQSRVRLSMVSVDRRDILCFQSLLGFVDI